MNQYNEAITSLWKVHGLKEYFISRHSYIPISDIELHIGKEAASFARKLCNITNCYPELLVKDDALQLRETSSLRHGKLEKRHTLLMSMMLALILLW